MKGKAANGGGKDGNGEESSEAELGDSSDSNAGSDDESNEEEEDDDDDDEDDSDEEEGNDSDEADDSDDEASDSGEEEEEAANETNAQRGKVAKRASKQRPAKRQKREPRPRQPRRRKQSSGASPSASPRRPPPISEAERQAEASLSRARAKATRCRDDLGVLRGALSALRGVAALPASSISNGSGSSSSSSSSSVSRASSSSAQMELPALAAGLPDLGSALWRGIGDGLQSDSPVALAGTPWDPRRRVRRVARALSRLELPCAVYECLLFAQRRHACAGAPLLLPDGDGASAVASGLRGMYTDGGGPRDPQRAATDHRVALLAGGAAAREALARLRERHVAGPLARARRLRGRAAAAPRREAARRREQEVVAQARLDAAAEHHRHLADRAGAAWEVSDCVLPYTICSDDSRHPNCTCPLICTMNVLRCTAPLLPPPQSGPQSVRDVDAAFAGRLGGGDVRHGRRSVASVVARRGRLRRRRPRVCSASTRPWQITAPKWLPPASGARR